MGQDSTRPRRRFAGLGVLPALFWAAAFAIAYCPAPLYYSNQNQYFLHGLAAAGRGDLAHDWLVTTRDPAPLFSAAVAWTATTFGDRADLAFQAAYYVLLGVYFLSLVALIDATLGLPPTRSMRFLLLTLLVAAHAVVVRLAAKQYTGIDIPRFLHYGVAAQYVTGPMLQPSAFGVFLLTSMAAFARGRLVSAVVFAAGTCVLHATYLLPAALLTLTYMLVLARNRRPWAALLLGAGTLLAVAPVVYFGLTQFGPTTPELYAEAQRVLAEVRIPHHAVLREWWDRIAKLQVVWVGLAIALSMGTRLFPLLAIPTLGAVALTVAQVMTGNLALALVFPWRVSAVLVPVATAVILTRLVRGLTPWPDQGRWLVRLVPVAAAALLAVMVYGGIVEAPRGTLYDLPATDAAELPLYAFVRDHREPGDVYLTPAATRPKGTAVSWDLQRFRLLTGATEYVDVKAIPYKDVELLEWFRRVQQAERWYAANDWDAVHDDLVAAGVTHVVVPTSEAAPSATLWRVYAGPTYCVYRVRR
ncbi:MAG TPA: DUF6798 domain-containing protein [Gemmataceae bacterium]|jgi:hypothetical protein